MPFFDGFSLFPSYHYKVNVLEESQEANDDFSNEDNSVLEASLVSYFLGCIIVETARIIRDIDSLVDPQSQ